MVKLERIDCWHTAAAVPWSWCVTTGMSGCVSTAASIIWRRQASPADLRCTGRGLQDHRVVGNGRRFQDDLVLLQAVDVEGVHTIAGFIGIVELLTKGNKGHSDLLVVFKKKEALALVNHARVAIN